MTRGGACSGHGAIAKVVDVEKLVKRHVLCPLCGAREHLLLTHYVPVREVL